jgi:formate hydrogenlyase subunit 3/multisubunit Na+/H+ antiporter MnhD subunit
MVDFLLSPFGAWSLLLAGGFLFYPLHRKTPGLALALFWLVQGFALAMAGLAAWRLWGGAEPFWFHTAGYRPPLSISLRAGWPEALVLLLVHGAGLAVATHFRKALAENASAAVLFLVLQAGAAGMVMTQDAFNLYVFMEISALSTMGLLAVQGRARLFDALFHAMGVEALAALFFLLGIGLVYHLAGTLSLAGLAAQAPLLQTPTGLLAQGFLAGALLLELKPLIANGPAINVYETTSAAMAAWLSTGAAAAMAMALCKLLPLFSPAILLGLQTAGLATFVVGHAAALRQSQTRRLLGYSSVAFLGFSVFFLCRPEPGLLWPLAVLWGVHALAKTLLFFLTDRAGPLTAGNARWHKLGLLASVLALLALPPVPAFWAKWDLVMLLARTQPGAFAILLAGFFVEAFYLSRWLREQWALAEESGSARPWPWPDTALAAIGLGGLGLACAALQSAPAREFANLALAALAALGLLSRAPRFAQKGLALLGAGALAWFAAGRLADPLAQLFLALFTAGYAVAVLAADSGPRMPRHFHGLMLAVFAGAVMVVAADGLFPFFFAWEWLAGATFLLIWQGDADGRAARQYLLFALASALFILLGFGLQQSLAPTLAWTGLSARPLVWGPVLLGLAIKLGLVGWHTWMAPSYSRAPRDFTPFLAGAVNKAAVFGLLLLLLPQLGRIASGPLEWLVWLGLLGAFAGAFLALFEENVLTMLAYSSMGQMAYVIAALGLATPTGNVAALYLSINHFLFKTLLFVVAAGVVRQTGTPLMYRMGGLIKRMPVSFVSAMMAVIAMSGVPPLGGFGGKWLLYMALMEKGQPLAAGLAFFASAVGFLYMYRFLQSVFLGQLKHAGRAVRETSWSAIAAQGLLIVGIMVFSVYPQPLLQGLLQIAGADRGAAFLSVAADGRVATALGQWQPTQIMIVVAVVFGVLTALLLANRQKVVWVRQFNLVFAGERPDRPETTHFAYDMFAHYRRALGAFYQPFALRFWEAAGQGLARLGHAAGHLQSGQFHATLLAGTALVVLLCLGALR